MTGLTALVIGTIKGVVCEFQKAVSGQKFKHICYHSRTTDRSENQSVELLAGH
jgi:hypothetical protein